MNFEPALARITAALEQTGIEYMLTGSFASTYYGAIRSTQDIDFVVAANPDQLRAFVGLLPKSDYYVDLGAALEAHRNESMFNIVDSATGAKIDLIMRKSRPFSREEFRRRVLADVEGMTLSVATAEDIVIAKLEWANLSESERQIEDVARVLRVQSSRLDRVYIEKWIRELGLTSEWTQAISLEESPGFC
jgi:hypothetical protein